MRLFSFGLLIVLLLACPCVHARDLYVVRADAKGPFINGVEYVKWTTDVFFHNNTAAAATITLVGISNGLMPDPRTSRTVSVPALRSTTLLNNGDSESWIPANVQIQYLWVLHLDVPDGVVAEDVMFIGRGSTLTGPVPFELRYSLGKLRLPTFTTLIPANQPQIHAATFLGAPQYIPSRTNVAIYNGSSVDATARVDFKDYCSDTTISSTVVSVPANTIVQPSFTTPTDLPPCDRIVPQWAVYTVVTMDQPGFSFVSNLSNRDTPLTSISVAY